MTKSRFFILRELAMLMLYLQAILLFCSFIIGFLISIPIGLNKSDYDGSCLLYAQIDKHGNKISHGPRQHFDFKNFKPGSTATCNFCIFTGAISLLLAVVLLCGTIFFIARNCSLKVNVRLMNTGWRSYGKPTVRYRVIYWFPLYSIGLYPLCSIINLLLKSTKILNFQFI